MIRSTPDPVFAAAAQAELERRVRLARPVGAGAGGGAPRSRRSWTMELAAVAGVTALVAAAAVGVTVLRPTSAPDEVPAGITSPTADAPPTASPLDSPSPSATATTPPTSPPPATTAPPTAPVSTPPATPTTPATPPPTSGAGSASGLVGPTGARVRTDAEIRSWTASIGFGEIWGEEAVLDMHCMAGKGFLYDPVYEHAHGIATAGMTAAQKAAFSDAYYGPQTDQPYDWRTAGCHGRSVHLMGQDDAH
ncbi:hypothetical protein [Amnibacterium setariae]|uniref:Uncharacterized protein n=1 Tax=Amnibacterium setariae TaxID=2306585 RepID=A0A3A1TW82_9MICO|nr:hypothetical protein [Amnibacterium setariae]RIX28482.1 hypothetical protein D1781_13740 [Amnibacterium setariae]